ncbi:MAG: VOC family protein [Actinomycetota bacterium]|nr:VOC family protein [Actinomycetota bacterium]
MPAFPPISHVALTVRDLSVGVPWYEDHVSFGCADRGELERWATRFDELGIEHGQIKDASYGSGLSFRDPDGIALEFFCPPG